MEGNSAFLPRRLTAILAADAANFSGLVAEDEERALRTLKRLRTGIDQAIVAHDGRIVTTAGDSVIAEFASPVQAVRAAVAIQQSIADGSARSDDRKPMRFRVGINIGDVVVDGGNLLGDGVNIAVRLESIAQPGTILVSSSVRDHVAGKLAVTMEDLGHQFLKNIPKPIRTYRVVFDEAESRALAARMGRATPRRIAVVASVVAIAGGLGFLWSHLAGAPPGAASDAKIRESVPSADERTRWEAVKLTTLPGELEAYLQRFPDGAYAELARARLSGLRAGQEQQAQNEELLKKRAEAAAIEAEAARLKSEADAAIARAAAEQATAVRLKAEAELAAARAAAAARAVVEAQQRTARTGTSQPAPDEQVILVRSTGPYDGRWTADWSCEASSDQPSSVLRLPVMIQYREIRIESGQVGLPGYYRAYGRIRDDGAFELKGTSLPKTQRIVGNEQAMSAAGRGEPDRLEGQGSIGARRCAVLIARGSLQ